MNPPDKTRFGEVSQEQPEEAQDQALMHEEKRKKARLRTRGPYRKAHVNW